MKIRYALMYAAAIAVITSSICFFASCSSGRMMEQPAMEPEAPKDLEGGKRKLGFLEDEKKKSEEKKEADESKPDDGRKPAKPSLPRMVVYSAQYVISVERVKESMTRIYDIVKKHQGFVESSVSSDSYRHAKLVIRVPVGKFDEALGDIAGLGEVVSRNVTAADVTMEFNDVSLRVETAKKVRSRLLELLQRVKDVKERVKILREISRLNSYIDTLAARRDYLKSRADFSTIEIELRAKVREVVHQYLPSPFAWISRLTPEGRSIFDDGGDVKYKNPEGFFFQKEQFYEKKSAPFLFQNPDQSVGMRIGVVDNYPKADGQFWNEAFTLDMKNRKYRIVKNYELRSGNNLFRTWIISIQGGRVYVISFAVSGEKIIVVEAVCGDNRIFESTRSLIDAFIQTVEVK